MIEKRELHRLTYLFKTCGPLFIALGDEIRQKIIVDIGDSGENGINVASLTAKSHLSRPAVSHHLKVLKDCGLVATKKIGTQIFYTLSLGKNVEQMEKLLSSINSSGSILEDNWLLASILISAFFSLSASFNDLVITIKLSFISHVQ